MAKWLKTTDHIKFTVKDRIARISFNRPEKRNALSVALQQELHDALLEADDLQSVSLVVLEGEGRDFCAGYDLGGSYGDPAKDTEAAARAAAESAGYRASKTFDDDTWQMERAQELRMTLFDMHKPVIAKVQGYCLAGGTDIALSCDIIIAAENDRIGFPATRGNGTPPSNWWLYHMGPQWAKRMLMTGDMLWGRDAARLGLVLDAVPAEQLDDAVMSLAQRMGYVDAELLATHKRAVNIGMEMMGARTMQRMALELDARAHLSAGPRRMAFRADVAEHGMAQAFKRRDLPFGDGMVRFGEKQQNGD